MELLIIAITLGFVGSFHCIGMCGPIAFALPIHRRPAAVRIFLILLYNSGRILTYSMFGMLAGLFGNAFVLAGFQQALSISAGILILVSVIISFTGKHTTVNSAMMKPFYLLKYRLSRLLQDDGRGSLFVIGLLNGLLPCGMVYAGIAGAMTTGSAAGGAAFMAAFGLGTLPVMFALPFAGRFISLRSRNSVRSAMPVMMTVIAVLLVLRGLNLGIPYISPKKDTLHNAPSCHQGAAINTQHSILCFGPPSQPTR